MNESPIAPEHQPVSKGRFGRLPALPARWLLPVGSAVLLLYLVVPVVVVLVRVLPDGLLPQYLARPIVTEALRLSIATTLISLLVTLLLGTPVAYLLARWEFPGKNLLDTLVDLPVVLPPAVAGVALLLTFGRRGVFGPFLSSAGIELGFSTAAVVLAQVFVSAPFFVRAAKSGFAQVDESLEVTARTLGVGPVTVFFRVTMPLAMPSLVGGAVLAWAKALGEFGATILFAGSFIGRTQTLPLAIYQALESDLNAALAISAILVVTSLIVLLLFRRVTGTLVGVGSA